MSPLLKRNSGDIDGPHAIIWTHAEEVNVEMLAFLAESRTMDASSASQH
jgi:hypothetical protein